MRAVDFDYTLFKEAELESSGICLGRGFDFAFLPLYIFFKDAMCRWEMLISGIAHVGFWTFFLICLVAKL